MPVEPDCAKNGHSTAASTAGTAPAHSSQGKVNQNPGPEESCMALFGAEASGPRFPHRDLG